MFFFLAIRRTEEHFSSASFLDIYLKFYTNGQLSTQRLDPGQQISPLNFFTSILLIVTKRFSGEGIVNGSKSLYFLLYFITNEITSILALQIVHSLIVIYQPLQRMEFTFYNSNTNCSLYSDFLQHHRIQSTKLLNH